MPTVALLSDIHANVHALRAVLDEVERLKIDRIVYCGDIVGYGPHPAECVKLVRETGGAGVLGNHDFYTVAASRQPGALPSDPESLCSQVLAGIHYAVNHLDQEAIEWLGSIPRAITIPGGVVAQPSKAKATTRLCSLDPGLFACLQDAGIRRKARETLVSIYFTPREQIMLCARLGLPVPNTADIEAMKLDADEFKARQKKRPRQPLQNGGAAPPGQHAKE